MIRPIKHTGSGRAPYVHHACGLCRAKRIRCTGERPVCHTCSSSGHAGECSWGREPVKRARGREYVQSLENRVESLVNYASLLETKLEQCRKEHGGLIDDYLHLRPDSPPVMDDDPDFEFNHSDNEDDIAERLRVFHLDGQDLYFYGRTSIFQFAQTDRGRLSRYPDIIEESKYYVLLVDGVDMSHYNPDFDWSRHLPPEVNLDRREHDKLLDLLFKFFTSWCLRIIPPLFLRDMYRTLSLPPSQPLLKTAHYSPMLHNALVALAMAFSDDPRIRDLKSRQYFARRAKSYIDTECHRPNISVINALSILGSFHSSLGDQTLGYLYFGMSGRVSQALGLSIDCSAWVKAGYITGDDMLDRNWVHWNTFCLDVCWSLYVGREFCVAAPSDRRAIPIPLVDTESEQRPWHYLPSGNPPQPNYLSSTFMATCQLLPIGRRTMGIVNTLHNPGTRQEVSHEIITKIDMELTTWKENLLPEVKIKPSNRATATPHQIMLELAYWWLIILLHRPFYRRPAPGSEKDVDHVKLCDRAARNIMELLGAWRSSYSLRYIPVTLIGVVFSAGTIFLLSAVQASSGARMAKVSFSHSVSQANLCIQYLHESGRSFQCATDIAGILQNLLHTELKSRLPSTLNLHELSTQMRESQVTPASTSTSPYVSAISSSPSSSSSSHPQQSFGSPSTSSQHSCYVWPSTQHAPVSAQHSGSHNQWSVLMQDKDDIDFDTNLTAAAAAGSSGAGLGSSFHTGPGMWGAGETFSANYSYDHEYPPTRTATPGFQFQLEGDRLERELCVLAQEEPQTPLELTEEDIEVLLQTLNQQQYPQSAQSTYMME